MTHVEGGIPLIGPPTWALLQRKLIEVNDAAVAPFTERYVDPAGGFTWFDRMPGHDAGDDLYEAYCLWPFAYGLGGSRSLLEHAAAGWEGITLQLTRLGHVQDEYFRGYDWFHQGEANVLLYGLATADPGDPRWSSRVRRFADLFLGPPNFDPELGIIRAAHTGSDGPRFAGPRWGSPAWGFADPDAGFGAIELGRPYGRPVRGVPGIERYDDLADPGNARRMLAAMDAQLGHGDTILNLGACGLVAHAFLVSGEERYREWVLRYVDGWLERARQNGGLPPDNVGLSGRVGEHTGGRWYGGNYGWTWPHGFYSIGASVTVAAQAAYLLSRDDRYLRLPRDLLDRMFELGEARDLAGEPMSLGYHLNPEGVERDFLVPHRHGPEGWFDWQQVPMAYPTSLWTLTLDPEDHERIERLRRASERDWSAMPPFHAAGDNGHERQWLRYLAGQFADYPERILQHGIADAQRRLQQIREDTRDPRTVDEHHWQSLSPVTTEALTQLTSGAPQVVQNGGLAVAPLRILDGVGGRPGLPADVGALVESVDRDELVVRLAHVGTRGDRDVVLQAGTFAEHRFDRVTWEAAVGDRYPGPPGSYALDRPDTERRETEVGASTVNVRLRPNHEVVLTLRVSRYVGDPRLPADQPTG
jgi:hypothetical protein